MSGAASGVRPEQHNVVDELTRTVQSLFDAGDVIELRTFGGGATFSGYFDNHDKLIREAARYDQLGHDVYITLNELPEQISYRRYNRVDKIKGRDRITSDNDVKRRRFLFIDLGPERVSGISSTDEEKRRSFGMVLEVRGFLEELGWPEPIICDSGNGYHLLYHIDLPNDRDSKNLVSGILDALDFKSPRNR